MLIHGWRNWRAKVSLLAPYLRVRPETFFAREQRYTVSPQSALADWPVLPPYEALADIWHAYSCNSQPNYSCFLQSVARRRGVVLRSILDLACGTGTLTERLARLAPEVVGLDASEPMLIQARSHCSGLPGVHFARADFREFNLDQQFDAVVCAYNSLNYLANPAELSKVLQCVARHLRPGGVFIFDTTTMRGMQGSNTLYYHAEGEGRRLVMHFRYDSRQRKQTVAVSLPSGMEMHRRIPIDPEDVAKATANSGLNLDDYFSSAIIPGRWFVGHFCFFVLSRT